MGEDNNGKETIIFNLKNPSDRKVSKVDESFWENVWYIFFHSPSLEIVFKYSSNLKDLEIKTHRFLHYEAYESVQDPSQAYTEKQKHEIWEEEGCEYCFIKNNDEFLNWFYYQARERKLIENDYKLTINDLLKSERRNEHK